MNCLRSTSYLLLALLMSLFMLTSCDEALPVPTEGSPGEMYAQADWESLSTATGKEAAAYQNKRGMDLEEQNDLDAAFSWYRLARANGKSGAGMCKWHFDTPKHWTFKEYALIITIVILIVGGWYFRYLVKTYGWEKVKTDLPMLLMAKRQAEQLTVKASQLTVKAKQFTTKLAADLAQQGIPKDSPWLKIPRGARVFLDTSLLLAESKDTNVREWFTLLRKGAADRGWTVVLLKSVVSELDKLKVPSANATESEKAEAETARVARDLVRDLKDELGGTLSVTGAAVMPAGPEFFKEMRNGDYLCTLDKKLGQDVEKLPGLHAPDPKKLLSPKKEGAN